MGPERASSRRMAKRGERLRKGETRDLSADDPGVIRELAAGSPMLAGETAPGAWSLKRHAARVRPYRRGSVDQVGHGRVRDMDQGLDVVRDHPLRTAHRG